MKLATVAPYSVRALESAMLIPGFNNSPLLTRVPRDIAIVVKAIDSANSAPEIVDDSVIQKTTARWLEDLKKILSVVPANSKAVENSGAMTALCNNFTYLMAYEMGHQSVWIATYADGIYAQITSEKRGEGITSPENRAVFEKMIRISTTVLSNRLAGLFLQNLPIDQVSHLMQESDTEAPGADIARAMQELDVATGGAAALVASHIYMTEEETKTHEANQKRSRDGWDDIRNTISAVAIERDRREKLAIETARADKAAEDLLAELAIEEKQKQKQKKKKGVHKEKPKAKASLCDTVEQAVSAPSTSSSVVAPLASASKGVGYRIADRVRRWVDATAAMICEFCELGDNYTSLEASERIWQRACHHLEPVKYLLNNRQFAYSTTKGYGLFASIELNGRKEFGTISVGINGNYIYHIHFTPDKGKRNLNDYFNLPVQGEMAPVSERRFNTVGIGSVDAVGENMVLTFGNPSDTQIVTIYPIRS